MQRKTETEVVIPRAAFSPILGSDGGDDAGPPDELHGATKLKDHESSWCSSMDAPVAAENPMATCSGSSAVRSTLALTLKTGVASPNLGLWSNLSSTFMTPSTTALIVPFRLKLANEMLATDAMELTSMPMWSCVRCGSQLSLNVSNSTATNL
ncbi:hypothetical protein U9M48_014138 [Paspalum notatum var. saurae]|uniref:Uncharacterized protein n=1 Tax=Paspalum notatum var. saurae TaxID=547442 RepID=A0AAQ3T3M1_PASNO